jgi:hypothetical protein
MLISRPHEKINAVLDGTKPITALMLGPGCCSF